MSEEELLEKIKQLEAEVSDLKLNRPLNQKLKSRDYSTTKYVPKNPLGMKDYHPEDMAVREAVMTSVRDIFKMHGAVEITTPVIELKDTLTGKYGEDSKLIYDLKDQGGEILALRYDLTVPFARYCAQHKVENLKRFQIARVYRRDRPVMAKGRYREFYQCDLDMAGVYESMTTDSECLKIVCDVLKSLRLNFRIKINHRKILDAIFEISGVTEDNLRAISSSVDKLDKLSWEEVQKEMISKGLEVGRTEEIKQFVQLNGQLEVITALESNEKFMNSEKGKEGLEDMKQLFKYLADFEILDYVSFDLSLARGLDYYTGMIFEAIALSPSPSPSSSTSKIKIPKVGSVAAGGRYDGLIGMFKKKKKDIPCVGLSLGIERLFVLYEKIIKEDKMKIIPTQVLICGVGAKKEEREDMLRERMKIMKLLWQNKVPCETIYKLNPKTLTQFQLCEDKSIPLAVIVAPEEISRGLVKVRKVVQRTEQEVEIKNLPAYIKKALNEISLN